MGLNSAIEALRDSKPKVYPKDKVGKWLIDLNADWINANTWRVLTDRYKLNVQRSRPPVHYKIHYCTEEIRLSINMTDKHSPLLTWIKNDIKKQQQNG